MSVAARRVMLVDDDSTIVETLAYNLKRQGFDTMAFKCGREAIAALETARPDLIILDWMLPDMVGPEICRLVRDRDVDTPILMLTGRSRPADVAHGLIAGADDYLTKPFSAIELMARIEALLRRTRKKDGVGPINLGELSLDDEARLVKWRGAPVDLSPKEFMLLRVLMRHAGKVLSTETIMDEVWGVDFSGDAKTLAVHIRWLRQKLEDDPKNPTLIETVHRAGYRLNPPPMGGKSEN